MFQIMLVRDFHQVVICVYRCRAKITSNRGSQFCSVLRTSLGKLMKIKMAKTSRFKPKCNRLEETRNKGKVNLLRCLADRNPALWDEQLPSVACLWTAYGHTAWNIIFGNDPITPIDHERLGQTDAEALSQIWETMLIQQGETQSMELHAARDLKLKQLQDKHVKDSKLLVVMRFSGTYPN